MEQEIKIRRGFIETRKLCFAIVLVDLLKVGPECLGADQVERPLLKREVAELVNSKDIGELGDVLQAEVNVVAEYEMFADGNDVTRFAVMLGGDSFGCEKFRWDRAKDLSAGLVELGHALPQLVPLAAQSIADDFVGAAFEFGRCVALYIWRSGIRQCSGVRS